MIIVKRIGKSVTSANFSLSLIPAIASIGGGGYAVWYALNARDKEFRHKQRDFMKKNPAVQAGLMTAFNPAVAVGYYGGKVFNRRRRTKNGKVIVEQVRRN